MLLEKKTKVKLNQCPDKQARTTTIIDDQKQKWHELSLTTRRNEILRYLTTFLKIFLFLLKSLLFLSLHITQTQASQIDYIDERLAIKLPTEKVNRTKWSKIEFGSIVETTIQDQTTDQRALKQLQREKVLLYYLPVIMCAKFKTYNFLWNKTYI